MGPRSEPRGSSSQPEATPDPGLPNGHTPPVPPSATPGGLDLLPKLDTRLDPPGSRSTPQAPEGVVLPQQDRHLQQGPGAVLGEGAEARGTVAAEMAEMHQQQSFRQPVHAVAGAAQLQPSLQQQEVGGQP